MDFTLEKQVTKINKKSLIQTEITKHFFSTKIQNIFMTSIPLNTKHKTFSDIIDKHQASV